MRLSLSLILNYYYQTFKATVDKNNNANAVAGNFETKFAYKPLNATITEKFNTRNVLSQVVSFTERGYKLEIDTAYALEKGYVIILLIQFFFSSLF